MTDNERLRAAWRSGQADELARVLAELAQDRDRRREEQLAKIDWSAFPAGGFCDDLFPGRLVHRPTFDFRTA